MTSKDFIGAETDLFRNIDGIVAGAELDLDDGATCWAGLPDSGEAHESLEVGSPIMRRPNQVMIMVVRGGVPPSSRSLLDRNSCCGRLVAA